MPLLNVDTGHHFPELNEFRDRLAKQLGARLIVRTVEEALEKGIAVQPPGQISRNQLQIPTLLAAIDEFRFDCCIGGGRRDEERARAKERVFSFRDAFGQWDPKNQRPELWSLYNARLHKGEGVRVFPISNWTELDVWQYVKREQLDLPSIYYAHTRPVFEENGMLMALSEHYKPSRGQEVFEAEVRFRTVGDATCTAAVRSSARTLEEIIRET